MALRHHAGVVDHLGHFTDIYVGWPGRVHDARVFSNSGLNSKGQNGTLFPDWKKHIAGREVPVVILGDPAYPLLPWLMKAFPDNGRLTQQQKTFTVYPRIEPRGSISFREAIAPGSERGRVVNGTGL